MSKFGDFLKNDYATHFGVVWNSSTMSLRMEIPASVRFEVADKEPRIIQPQGKGVSVLRRKEVDVEVIDIEDFTAFIHGRNNTPNSCDFAITPELESEYIVLNELTRTQSDYILPFVQPKTGQEQIGKLEYAKMQLTETINRLYEVSNFCDQYPLKIALFSCRLSDKKSNGIMARSARAFNKSIYKLQHMKLHEQLPHGFAFEMRVYDAEYRLP